MRSACKLNIRLRQIIHNAISDVGPGVLHVQIEERDKFFWLEPGDCSVYRKLILCQAIRLLCFLSQLYLNRDRCGIFTVRRIVRRFDDRIVRTLCKWYGISLGIDESNGQIFRDAVRAVIHLCEGAFGHFERDRFRVRGHNGNGDVDRMGVGVLAVRHPKGQLVDAHRQFVQRQLRRFPACSVSARVIPPIGEVCPLAAQACVRIRIGQAGAQRLILHILCRQRQRIASASIRLKSVGAGHSDRERRRGDDSSFSASHAVRMRLFSKSWIRSSRAMSSSPFLFLYYSIFFCFSRFVTSICTSYSAGLMEKLPLRYAGTIL